MLLKENSCCFTGHRNIPIALLRDVQILLQKEIIMLINKGITCFLAGGAIGFDMLASVTVLNLKSVFPHTKLVIALPCKNHTYNWNLSNIELFERIKSKADDVIITSDCYHKGCMTIRNQFLVDNSNYCICYQIKNTGGTYYTVNYACKKNLNIVNIANGNRVDNSLQLSF